MSSTKQQIAVPTHADSDLLTVIIDSSSGYHVDEPSTCIFKGTGQRAKLGECAQSGCPVCILGHDAALKCWPDVATDSSLGVNMIGSQRDPFQNFGLIYHTRTYYDRKIPWIEFFVDEEEVAGVECIFYGRKTRLPSRQRRAPCSTKSPQTLQTVRGWIAACDDTHKCRMSKVSKLPRRVLDVRNDNVRVYESHGEAERYACLSHRWGDPKVMLCTTTDCIADFQNGIPWERLPKNFQDAISFVRSLDVAFIWIDSLCIIQDSQLDWQEQSAQMAAIYQNAYITLAAAVTETPSDGLFTKEDARTHLTRQTPAVARVGEKSYPIYARVEFEHNSASLPLFERGWVYQERLLSPRLVHFAGEEVVWECSECQDCECGSSNVVSAFLRPAIPTPQSAKSATDTLHTLWRKVTQDYSTLRLTYESDALPALSGLASAFAAMLENGKYAAGLWQVNLLPDLLWYRVAVRPPPPGANVAVKPWRAPSWSWVSARFVPGKVCFAPFSEAMAEVEEIMTESSGANPYGQLTSANLRIKARAISTTFQADLSILVAGRTVPVTTSSLPSFEMSGIEGALPEVFALHNQELYKGRLPLSVNILQIGRYLNSQQQIRYYLVIAKDSNTDEGRWERLGLMAVPENQSWYPGQLAGESEEMRTHNLQGKADGNRRMFRAFDETATQEFTIY